MTMKKMQQLELNWTVKESNCLQRARVEILIDDLRASKAASPWMTSFYDRLIDMAEWTAANSNFPK